MACQTADSRRSRSQSHFLPLGAAHISSRLARAIPVAIAGVPEHLPSPSLDDLSHTGVGQETALGRRFPWRNRLLPNDLWRRPGLSDGHFSHWSREGGKTGSFLLHFLSPQIPVGLTCLVTNRSGGPSLIPLLILILPSL
jgi:hypothetical protein